MITVLTALALVGLVGTPAMSKVAGRCDNCHTMHFSQGGLPWDDSGGPHKYLLDNDCVGCHSHESAATYTIGTAPNISTVPVVFITGSAPAEYLAGGNFYWVSLGGATNDPKGHNVLGIKGQDSNIPPAVGAPGGWITCANSCHATLAAEQTVVPELGSGCMGCHLRPSHHANDHANGESGLVNSADQGWYRFLSGHMSGDGDGVEGFEDGMWEKGQPDLPQGQAGNHNEYLGFVGDHVNFAGFYNLGHTTTAYCCGCHGNFHIENPTDRFGTLRDWQRHPSDAVIPNESEYAATGGDSNLYDPLSPVARPTVDATPSGTVTPGADMVMCLSCHRPHGSPYDDLLRWDYASMEAGDGSDDKGCFYCHTTKNDA